MLAQGWVWEDAPSFRVAMEARAADADPLLTCCTAVFTEAQSLSSDNLFLFLFLFPVSTRTERGCEQKL